MRQRMQERVATAKDDRKTILQFFEWLKTRYHGKLSVLLTSGTSMDLDVSAELDEFYDIDRDRLQTEDALYGPTEEMP